MWLRLHIGRLVWAVLGAGRAFSCASGKTAGLLPTPALSAAGMVQGAKEWGENALPLRVLLQESDAEDTQDSTSNEKKDQEKGGDQCAVIPLPRSILRVHFMISILRNE